MRRERHGLSIAGKDLRGDRRSVSNVVGFVLMFGIIITSVGLVSTVGMSQLDDFNDQQQIRNADRTFELMARSFDEVVESQTTVRTEAIDLNGGSIRVDPTSSVRVTVYDASDTVVDAETIPLNALVYRMGKTAVAYENGATIRTKVHTDSGLLLHKPQFICDDGHAVLSIVTVKPKETRQISGDRTLRITGRRTNTSLLFPTATSGRGNASSSAHVDLTYHFSSASRAREWGLYFEHSDGNWTVTGSTDSSVSARCGSNLDRVYVRRTVLTISYS